MTEIHEGKITTRGRMLRFGSMLSMPGLAWLLFFLFAPMIVLAVMAFATRGTYGSVEWTFSSANFWRLMGFGLFGWTQDTLMILLRSGLLAAVTTVLCVAFSFPLAFWIASKPKSSRHLWLAIVMVPSCTNIVIRTYAWMLLLGNHMPPAWIARTLGLLGAEQNLYPGSLAVYLGMTSAMLPFAVLPIYTSVERMDWNLVEAARDLYANSISTFRNAILPQVMPGMIAAIVFTMVPTLGMFVVSDLLGGARHMLIGNLIQQQFGAASDWPYGAMAGLFLVASSLVSLALFHRFGSALLHKTTRHGGQA